MGALRTRRMARVREHAPMSWTFVQHAHTHHSFDSLADPAALVRKAQEAGVHALAITDHDTWAGAVDAQVAATAAGSAVRVVLSSEVRTECGDLIGMFLVSDVLERDPLAFCEAVHAQGGLVLLPHPYKWHRLDQDMLARIDLIEVHNARCSAAENARALELARERGLPALVGPDAHRVGELLLARNVFEGEPPSDDAALKHALLHAPRQFHLGAASMWNEWLSQAVKFSRRPSFALGVGLARGAARRILKPAAYRDA